MPLLVVVAVVAVLLLWRRLGQVSGEEAGQLLAKGARVIDVRTPQEYEAGHVAGSENLPLGEIGDTISAAVPDRETPLLLYCLSGTRSAAAVRILRAKGYQNVSNLGSISRARRLVESPRSTAPSGE